MEMSVIIESVTSLFIIILVGVYGSKRNIITPEVNKALIAILIQIALPFMILSSFTFTYSDTVKSNVINTFYYSIIGYILIIAVSHLMLLPIKNDKKTILHFANVFTNTGYVGFPILNSIYGPEGIIYGSIFNMFFVILLWTYGLMLFRGDSEKNDFRNELKKILTNPSIIAVCIGIIIMVSNIKPPRAILSSINSIGSITGPLSMIIIGVILSNTKIQKYLKDWTLYYGVITKLIIIPGILYFLSLLVGTSKAINTVIIMSAMPAAAMTAILAENFDTEKEYAAVIVSVTTLLSLITVTLLLRIIL
ncbi:putative permease [Alkaliphilus hydrothermalis]|uniref:Permease n=2 Tax=Alkaliphilus hydrothermalis TaxID=1482730 RepID=A0ABS2NPK5_9FIRM|nr:putative permease [Alkaliphilus hydrothermalis]